ncbi:MAG: MATE family efflux transporter [Bacilli bacterium]
MLQTDLTKGSVLTVLQRLTIPLIGSSLLQFMYNMIDMFWVGGLGSGAVAAVGTIAFLTGLMYAVQSFIVVGAGVPIAQHVGRKESLRASAFVHAGIWWTVALGMCTAVLLLCFGQAWVAFFQLDDPQIERDALAYLFVSVPALLFAYFNIYFARVWASYGNTKQAMKFASVGLVINIVLDPLLIYGFDLGVAGAAWATLVGNVIVFVLFTRHSPVNVFRIPKPVWKDMQHIAEHGVPMMLQRVLFMLVNIVLARMIAVYGAEAIAGHRIGLQIESIAYMVIGGLGGAVTSFAGQNYGAGQYVRITKGYHVATRIGIVYASLITLLFIVIPEPLVRIFIEETEAVNVAVDYLTIVGYSLIFAAVEMISNGFFTGIGRAKIPATVSILFTIARIPLAVIFMSAFGLAGVWWSIALSSILKGAVLYGLFQREWRKKYDVKHIKVV